MFMEKRRSTLTAQTISYVPLQNVLAQKRGPQSLRKISTTGTVTFGFFGGIFKIAT